LEHNEHRETARHHTLKGAKVVFNNRSSVISCHVIDLTPKGACIEVPTTLGIPAEFELFIDLTKEWHACTVAWHSGSRIGVEFPEQRPHAAADRPTL
jgi:hypothetical protein